MSDFDFEERRKTQQRDQQATGPEAHPLGRASALGNAGIQRLLRASVAGSTVDDELASAIDAKRGGGQSLDSQAQSELGASLGDDFSDVRVHTDSEADQMNRDLQADAFTTGKDIFFREGKYQPGSSDGQKLLAHELTHVVQQRSGSRGGSEMTVSDPGDASEREASAVADKVGSGGPSVAREGLEEEELATSRVSREDVPEEEELATSPAIDRQEEEEELAMSPAVAREGFEEEEEELATSPSLDRQEEPEEEELAMSSAIAREGVEEEEQVAT